MKARVALLASLFSLCLVAVVAAQVSTIDGTVVSNSGGSLVVNTDSGERTFMVDAQSSLPADLAVGSRVRVEYHTLANDKFHAFKVSTLGSSTDTPASGTSASMGTGTTGTTTAGTTSNNNYNSATNNNDTTNTMGTSPTATAPKTGTTTTTTTDRVDTTGNTAVRNDTTTTTQTTTDTTMGSTQTTTGTTDTTTTGTSGRNLPATASPLPLLALVGTLALGAGALLRLRRA